MTHFIGLRSKLYSFKVEDQKPINKVKGIKKQAAAKITYEDYEKFLFEEEIIVKEQHVIRSRLHKIYSESEKKIALSPHDDKRYLIPNSTDTLAWGHYRIQQMEEQLENLPGKRFKLSL